MKEREEKEDKLVLTLADIVKRKINVEVEYLPYRRGRRVARHALRLALKHFGGED